MALFFVVDKEDLARISDYITQDHPYIESGDKVVIKYSNSLQNILHTTKIFFENAEHPEGFVASSPDIKFLRK